MYYAMSNYITTIREHNNEAEENQKADKKLFDLLLVGAMAKGFCQKTNNNQKTS